MAIDHSCQNFEDETELSSVSGASYIVVTFHIAIFSLPWLYNCKYTKQRGNLWEASKFVLL